MTIDYLVGSREQEQELYGFDERETWNLDLKAAEWLYSHVKMYDEINIINTSFHKFIYKDVEYTQQQLIDKLLENLSYYLINHDTCDFAKEKESYIRLQEAFRIFAEILPAMWW